MTESAPDTVWETGGGGSSEGWGFTLSVVTSSCSWVICVSRSRISASSPVYRYVSN